MRGSYGHGKELPFFIKKTGNFFGKASEGYVLEQTLLYRSN